VVLLLEPQVAPCVRALTVQAVISTALTVTWLSVIVTLFAWSLGHQLPAARLSASRSCKAFS
jgi:hypothetical protein